MNFISYLKDCLIEYFKKNPFSGGQRFFVKFESPERVSEFYNSFSSQKDNDGYSYVSFGDMRLMVIPANNIRDAHLVFTRNKFSLASDKATLFIFSDTIESIEQGSQSLLGEGCPLNAIHIAKEMMHRIGALADNNDNKVKKPLLEEWLDQKNKELENSELSCFDYQDGYEIIHKSQLEAQDFLRLGYFYDSFGKNDTTADIHKKLQANKKLYNRVLPLAEIEALDSLPEKEFDSTIIEDLKKVFRKDPDTESYSKWGDVSFSLMDRHIRNARVRLPLIVEKYSPMLDQEHLIRRKGEGNIARNKFQLMLFLLPEEQTCFNFTFDQSINQAQSRGLKPSEFEIDNRKLSVTLSGSNDIQYKSFRLTKNNNEFSLSVLILPAPVFKREEFETVPFEIKAKGIIYFNASSSCSLGKESEETSEKEIERDEDVPFDTSFYPVALSDEEDNKTITFRLIRDNYALAMEMKSEKESLLIRNAVQIAQEVAQKRCGAKDVSINQNFVKIRIGARCYKCNKAERSYFLLERQIIDQEILCGTLSLDTVNPVALNLPEKVKEAFSRLITEIKNANTILSFVYWTAPMKKAANEYLDSIFSYLEEKRTGGINQLKDLCNIGVIYYEQGAYLSPFHPLILAYFMQTISSLSEDLESKQLINLYDSDLMPYFAEDVANFKQTRLVPNFLMSFPLWRTYESHSKSSLESSTKILTNTVVDKLTKFNEIFEKLVFLNKESKLVVNVFNLMPNLPVLTGVICFVRKTIENEANQRGYGRKVHVNVYNEKDYKSDFERFSYIHTPEELSELLGVDIFDGLVEHEKLNLFSRIMESISYSVYTDSAEPQQAHISFCKMNMDNILLQSKHTQKKSSFRNGDLNVALTATENDSIYSIGLGSKNYSFSPGSIQERVLRWNELLANFLNAVHGDYVSDIGIYKGVEVNNSKLDWVAITERCFWMVIVEPEVDIDYFINNPNVKLIFYSDSSTNSSLYSSITLTAFSELYESNIEGYFKDKGYTDINYNNIIKYSNQINGEWLLSLIDYQPSKIDTMLKTLGGTLAGTEWLKNQVDASCEWVSLSVQELVRASSSQTGFSSKLLRGTNSENCLKHSGQLLFLGFKTDENNKLDVYISPGYIEKDINTVSPQAMVAQWKSELEEGVLNHTELTLEGRNALHFLLAQGILNMKKMISIQKSNYSYQEIDRLEAALLKGDFRIHTMGYYLFNIDVAQNSSLMEKIDNDNYKVNLNMDKILQLLAEC